MVIVFVPQLKIPFSGNPSLNQPIELEILGNPTNPAPQKTPLSVADVTENVSTNHQILGNLLEILNLI